MKLAGLVAGAGAVVLLGMCKNAGKTTALCRLIREYAAGGEKPACVGLTSVGRDGERRDLVTGTEKPPVYIYSGMLCATAEGLLPFCDVSREILMLTGLRTSLGEVVLFRARSDGYVQLAGPSMVEQLAPLREAFSAHGAEQVLIDGALSRRSPAAAAAESGGCCILATGASLGRDMDAVAAETAFAAELLTLPRAVSPAPEDRALPGAFTETQAAALLRSGEKLENVRFVARDGSRYLLKRETYAALKARGARFAVERETRLAAVTVNPVSAGGWRFDAERFLEKLRAVLGDVPALNVGRVEL